MFGHGRDARQDSALGAGLALKQSHESERIMEDPEEQGVVSHVETFSTFLLSVDSREDGDVRTEHQAGCNAMNLGRCSAFTREESRQICGCSSQTAGGGFLMNAHERFQPWRGRSLVTGAVGASHGATLARSDARLLWLAIAADARLAWPVGQIRMGPEAFQHLRTRMAMVLHSPPGTRPLKERHQAGVLGPH